MLKKIKEKCVVVRKRMVDTWGVVKSLGMTAVCIATVFPMNVYAAGDYTKGINKLKTIFVTVIGAAGVIVLAYGGLNFAESFKKKDQNGEFNALYTVAAGTIMVGIDAIIAELVG